MTERSETCATCRYYEPGHQGPDAEYSLCRRSPPRVMGEGDVDLWPVVHPDDWCGEWRATREAEEPSEKCKSVVLCAADWAAEGFTIFEWVEHAKKRHQ